MTRMGRLVWIALLPLGGQAADHYVPEELEDWRAWVLEDKEYLDCPFLFDRGATDRDDFVCAWPGTLDLAVDAGGARFTQSWTVYAAEQWVPLPGDTDYWPDAVTANAAAVTVVARSGIAHLRLDPGHYRIAGRFEWDERPGVLRIPGQSGLVTLSVDGRRVDRPERNNGGIFLGERQREVRARDAVTVDVHRLVIDDVPTRLTTRLSIDVSGGVREESFGPLLPDGFVPLTLDSRLPARLEPDGKLRVQVRPGRWVVTLTARGPAVLNTVAHPGPADTLPGEEIWSYRSTERLRVTMVEGPAPVDPIQTQVPPEWQQLPAFRIRPGETLTIAERSRGLVATDNDLELDREMWLDFDGRGFIVSDSIGGTLRTGWRLDMVLPYALLNAVETDVNLLITTGDEDGESGVELRRTDVELETIGRVESRGAMPVTGWDARFSGVAAELHLPPGHKLIAAAGADRAPGSWVGRWRLLDFFLVLIITIGAWRLFGPAAGGIALLALVLSFHEAGAPTWLWLNLLVAFALLRVAPPGRLRQSARLYQALGAVGLVLALVPFLANQLRIAIYPQLEPQRQYAGYYATPEPAADKARLFDAADGKASRPSSRRLPESGVMAPEEAVVTGGIQSIAYARYAPDAIVQAGPGIPSWQWNSYRLDWSGPVDADQVLRLVILPRWAVTALRLIEALALLLLTAILAAEALGRKLTLPGGLTIGRARQASSWCAAGLITLLLAASPDARAESPAPELLRELEQRLTAPPECAPRCAEIVAAAVDVDADSLSMRLTVHALDQVAVPLPGSEQGWWPVAASLDGSPAGQILRGDTGELWLRIGPGRHYVALSGAMPAVDSLEVPFWTPPRVIEVDANGWFVSGIRDRRLLSGSLQLTRLQTTDADDASPRWESSRFPAFVRVERDIRLDLDWYATTTVVRVAPEQGALTLEIPLLVGEAVISEGITISEGKALVSMNPNQHAVSWRSKLPRVAPLELTATDGAPWREVWRIGVGSIWHAEFSGVPESGNPDAALAVRTAEFYPRSGEKLTIDATRPEASTGSTLAFDTVNLAVVHGSRSHTATLELEYRSTRGERHEIRLPQGAEVTAVQIDSQPEPLRAEGGVLTVPILPGEHDISVSWRGDGPIGLRTATPAVDIGAPASNISLSSELPRNRWLLATNGPALGPGVLYWSELAVLVLFAVILGRIRLTPLRTRHWLLLGLGFSTFSWPVLGLVVAWLLIAGARRTWDGDVRWWQFNAVQLIFVGVTLGALLAVVSSLPGGLLGSPDMHVTGNGSFGNSLNWFADAGTSALPVAGAWTLPLWTYKVLILAWALWLSFALLRWLPWVWECFSSQGYWRSRKRPVTE